MSLLLYIVIYITVCVGWSPLSISNNTGERWAVLVGGAQGWENYDSQANICHAYKILRKGGLKEENIIVFMYDDIAYDVYNKKPGKIYHELKGNDFYRGVRKDYTSELVTSENFYNALLGHKNETIGKKVLKSGSNDNVFIYFAGHGGRDYLCMPQKHDSVRRNDFLKVLSEMHSNALYKQMVVYVDACYSGSMFHDVKELNDMNIFATTSTSFHKSSYKSSYMEKWRVYLTTEFSYAWMNDCEKHNLRKITFNQQFARVKEKVGKGKYFRSIPEKFGSERVGEQYMSEFFIKHKYIG